jgi:hypothetical protein
MEGPDRENLRQNPLAPEISSFSGPNQYSRTQANQSLSRANF